MRTIHPVRTVLLGVAMMVAVACGGSTHSDGGRAGAGGVAPAPGGGGAGGGPPAPALEPFECGVGTVATALDTDCSAEDLAGLAEHVLSVDGLSPATAGPGGMLGVRVRVEHGSGADPAANVGLAGPAGLVTVGAFPVPPEECQSVPLESAGDATATSFDLELSPDLIAGASIPLIVFVSTDSLGVPACRGPYDWNEAGELVCNDGATRAKQCVGPYLELWVVCDDAEGDVSCALRRR